MPLNTLKRFIRLEAIAGILLFVAAALSMVVANSPIANVVADALNARAAVIIKWRWFEMPAGANMLMLYGTALATGIGFTMSFFIGFLAYENLDSTWANSMKLGVL